MQCVWCWTISSKQAGVYYILSLPINSSVPIISNKNRAWSVSACLCMFFLSKSEVQSVHIKKTHFYKHAKLIINHRSLCIRRNRYFTLHFAPNRHFPQSISKPEGHWIFGLSKNCTKLQRSESRRIWDALHNASYGPHLFYVRHILSVPFIILRAWVPISIQ